MTEKGGLGKCFFDVCEGSVVSSIQGSGWDGRVAANKVFSGCGNFNLGVYRANTLTAHMMPQKFQAVDPEKAMP